MLELVPSTTACRWRSPPPYFEARSHLFLSLRFLQPLQELKVRIRETLACQCLHVLLAVTAAAVKPQYPEWGEYEREHKARQQRSISWI